jgi:hypothetical protein
LCTGSRAWTIREKSLDSFRPFPNIMMNLIDQNSSSPCQLLFSQTLLFSRRHCRRPCIIITCVSSCDQSFLWNKCVSYSSIIFICLIARLCVFSMNYSLAFGLFL